MSAGRGLVTSAVAVLLGAAQLSCNGTNDLPQAGHEILQAPPETISVYQLAGRLAMRITAFRPSHVRLQDERNTVLIFGAPAGRAYVNGAPVEPGTEVVEVGGVSFVPVGLEGKIRLGLRPPAPRPAVQKHKRPETPQLGFVVLDPGHGGKDPGAISVFGLPEKSVNLAVGLEAAELLARRGVDVALTRRDDRFVELNDRPAVANHRPTRLFVSIHADWNHDRSAEGFAIYVAQSPSGESLSAAAAIATKLTAAGVGNRGVRRHNYRVLARSTCPAVLVELGFLSNPREAILLSQEAHQRRLAAALADGIVEFLRGQ